MRKIIPNLIITLFCFLKLFSCNIGIQEKKKNDHIGNNTIDKNSFEFYTQASFGIKLYYTIINETTTKLKVNEQEKKTYSNSEVGLVYETSRDSLENTIVRITYDKIQITIKKDDAEEEVLDADNAEGAFDTVDKLLSIIKGSPITITINKKGQVINVSGSKELSDKVMASLITSDPNARAKVQELLSQLIGDKFIRNSVEQDFILFPDTALHIGDSWNKKNEETNIIGFNVDSKYTLSSVEDAIAEVEVSGTIGNGKPSTTVMMGKEVTTILEGTQSGKIQVDENSGLVLSSNTKTSINGTIQVMGKEIPLTINIKKEIISKRK